MDAEGTSRGVKQDEGDNKHPYGDNPLNEWSYTLTSQYIFTVCTGTAAPLTLRTFTCSYLMTLTLNEGLHEFVQAHSPSLDNYRNERCFNKNCRQQAERSAINVTLRYVHAIIVVGEISIIHSECVSVALVIQHAMSVRHNVICG